MKNIDRTLFWTLLLTVSIVIPGLGQEEQKNDTTAVEIAKERTEEQRETLSLSEQQEKLMYDVNLKYIEEMLVIRTEGRSVSALKRLREMSDRMDQEVVVILNEDQYTNYLKMKDRYRKEMKKRMKSE